MKTRIEIGESAVMLAIFHGSVSLTELAPVFAVLGVVVSARIDPMRPANDGCRGRVCEWVLRNDDQRMRIPC